MILNSLGRHVGGQLPAAIQGAPAVAAAEPPTMGEKAAEKAGTRLEPKWLRRAHLACVSLLLLLPFPSPALLYLP